MFTHFVQLVLRAMAGAAFTVASSVVVLTTVLEPQAAFATPMPGPQPPPQRFTVAADVRPLPVPTRDRFTVVQPPKPTPAPVQASAADSAPAATSADSAPASSYTTPVGTAQAYAAEQVSASNFSCLVNLWNRESGWNTHAENADSGAYGIPQSLPGSKMATAGSDWADNYKTQINWGLSYIASAYGSACNAWAHSNAYGWY